MTATPPLHSERARGAAPPASGPATVLVVDDEPKTLVVFGDILGLDGYRVETASDGREALERFDPARHAAVITDIRMPGVSGIELVERIRQRDDAVPVLILTGYATVETATRAVAAGASEYLLKPIDFDRLKLSLRRAIERARLLGDNRRLVAELRDANQRLEGATRDLEARVRARTRDLAYQRDLLENVVGAIPSAVAIIGVVGRGDDTARLERLSENGAFQRLGGAGRELVRLLGRDLAAIASGRLPSLARDLVVDEPGAGGEPGASWALRVRALPLRAGAVEAGGAEALHKTGPIAVAPVSGRRVLLVADDVTDAVRVEDELVQVEKLLSLGTLAGGVVHDLANPLTAILGTAEMLREDAREADARQGLDAILEASRYMRDVCSGLTEFARRARRGETTSARPNEVVERALAFARWAKKLARIEVATRLAPDVPEVAASASELTQVLVNLVSNAGDAIAGSGAESGRIEVATERAGRVVRIRVADSGPGIPEAAQASLFAPFFTTKGAGKGTGLGLFTSRRIVKRLGGRIDFTTGAGGTTFTIELPVAAAVVKTV